MERMEKQTAVEWLFEQLADKGILHSSDIAKAKAMEKEQIIDAFVECWKANVPDGIECKLDAEQYYNKTFKSE